MTITCQTCGRQYPPVDDMMPKQGDRCAALVRDNLVAGRYGSHLIDLELWRFKDQRPDRIKEGIICDDCVQQLMDTGEIIIADRSFW